MSETTVVMQTPELISAGFNVAHIAETVNYILPKGEGAS